MDKSMEKIMGKNLGIGTDFARQIAQAVGELWGNGCAVEAVKVPKNNGMEKDALMVRRDGQQAAPLIYLSPYFKQYQAGCPLDVVARSVYNTVREIDGLPEKDYGGFGQMLDFQKVKRQIIYQLVNLERNEKMLEEMPYRQACGDLAVVFLLLLGQGEHGQVVTQVTKRHMEIWGTSADELWKLSKANTPRLQPVKLVRLQDMITELATGLFESSGHPIEEDVDGEMVKEMAGFREGDGNPLGSAYLLTNSINLRGAAAILYPDVLKRAAEWIGGDLIIFPSSIHETILMKREECFKQEEAARIVREINQEAVAPEDRLSDKVYYYSWSEERIGTVE